MTAEEMLARVAAELARYEHPLFAFSARAADGGVEIAIRYRPAAPDVHDYAFLLRPREIESGQFPWMLEKQLFDCLHDYVIEMFIRTPQRQD